MGLQAADSQGDTGATPVGHVMSWAPGGSKTLHGRDGTLSFSVQLRAMLFSGKRQTDHTDGKAYVPFTG